MARQLYDLPLFPDIARTGHVGKMSYAGACLTACFRVGSAECSPFSPSEQGHKHMGSHASQSRDLRWRRLYEAAVVEVDQEILPRRVRAAQKAIHLQIVKLHKVDEAGDVWALMDALNVLNDLLRMNQADLSRRALACNVSLKLSHQQLVRITVSFVQQFWRMFSEPSVKTEYPIFSALRWR
jgi:hypothetical protein